jgi:hypothetical protein
MHICLKEGHTAADQLKAWVHAVEVGMLWSQSNTTTQNKVADDEDEASALIRMAQHHVEEHLPVFVDRMCRVGWNTDGHIMTGVPRALLMSARSADPPLELDGGLAMERRKDV